MEIQISEKEISIENISGDEFQIKYGFKCPIGVRGRNSDNRLFKEKMEWEPRQPLYDGMKSTYDWISKTILEKKNKN